MTKFVQFTATAGSGTGSVTNVWNVISPNPLTGLDMTALLTCFKNFYSSCANIFASGQVTTVGTRCLYRDTAGGPPVILTATAQTSTAGTGGTMFAPQVAACISWSTFLAGRSYRGRTFLGLIGTNAVVQGVIQPSQLAAANTAASTLITAVKGVSTSGGGALALGVYSRKQAHIEEIVSGSMNNRSDTMRSRNS